MRSSLGSVFHAGVTTLNVLAPANPVDRQIILAARPFGSAWRTNLLILEVVLIFSVQLSKYTPPQFLRKVWLPAPVPALSPNTATQVPIFQREQQRRTANPFSVTMTDLIPLRQQVSPNRGFPAP